MFLSRPILFVSLFVLCWEVHLSAQTTPVQSQPMAQQQIQQPPVQRQVVQVQPIRAPQIQAPLFGTQNGPTAQQPQPTAQSAAPNVPVNTQPIFRVASANPAAPPPTGQSVPLYERGGANQVPLTIQPPPTAQDIPQGMAHVGRAEPASKIVPFFLNPAEQQELDAFLARWERYSADIKRYDVEFYMFEYDPTIPGASPNEPHRISYGNFKYFANPRQFLYVVEGEFRDGKYIKRDGDKNPHIFAEKIIIDEKTVTKYDYNSKTVHQINVPPEMIGKGIAESPLPLIFGAKADELKRRFSMKVVNEQNDMIRLFARPLLVEDQKEFKEIEIILEKDLRARGLRQWDINDKTCKTFRLHSTKINDKLDKIVSDIKSLFTPETPSGWKREVHDWVLQQPPPQSAVPQPQVAGQAQASQQYGDGASYYRGQ